MAKCALVQIDYSRVLHGRRAIHIIGRTLCHTRPDNHCRLTLHAPASFSLIFSFVALGLAAIGISSVVAYSVEQRTREFGIRTALGAPQWNVLLLARTSIARTTGMGLILGILLSRPCS
jgi:ABC-type antimicrobial peptide transport system permease subunit